MTESVGRRESWKEDAVNSDFEGPSMVDQKDGNIIHGIKCAGSFLEQTGMTSCKADLGLF